MNQTQSRWVAFQPLRHRNFALVWSAALISNVGTWMETVAVGDLVTKETGQAGWTALVAAAGFLPMGLMGPIGGAIADRVDRRKFMIYTTVLHMMAAITLTTLSATGNASPIAVTAVIFVAGCVAGIGFPAYQAMIPDLVPASDLLSAVSLGTAQYNLGRVIGPALAGITIALGSYTWAFGINAVSFAAMVIALSVLKLTPREVEPDPTSLWSRIRVGARVARGEPGVASAILMISIIAVTTSPFIALLPAMARVRHGGGEALTSAFVTAQGVGAVGGAVLLPVLASRFGARRVLVRGFVALPFALTIYALAPSPITAVLALVLVGVSYIVVFSGIGTVVQMRAPVEFRARVLSLYFLALGVLYPVGAVIQGPVGDRIGLPEVTIAGAAVMLTAVAILRVRRPETFLSLDSPEAYPTSPAPAA